MALKPNSIAVFNFVKENDGADFTAQDIAEALDLEPSPSTPRNEG